MNARIVLLLAFALSGWQATLADDFKFCYSGDCAPVFWPEHVPGCGGYSQSPIDVNDTETYLDSSMEPIEFTRFDQTEDVEFVLKNNGHAIQVDVDLSDSAEGAFQFSGGNLAGTFQVIQFHFHFGSQNDRGSEHTRNGEASPMETHLVAYNTKYATFGDAVDKIDGLAVISSFFEIGQEENTVFDEVAANLGKVANAGDSTDITPFSLLDFLPADKDDYFRYAGSLTTPGCDETVVWTILRNKISISQGQMNDFRSGLENHAEAELVDNFRPTQPLNARVVYRNFEL